MNLIKNFLKKLKPFEKNDPFFGPLTYMKMPKGRLSYWEAKKRFCGGDVELFIDAPAPMQLPNEEQRAFFSDVEKHYDDILPSAVSVILAASQDLHAKNFIPVSFSIPLQPLDKADWEISFEITGNSSPLFSVAMKGIATVSVVIDG
jgi:hypothetical protein